jgi:hypothetical protein
VPAVSTHETREREVQKPNKADDARGRFDPIRPFLSNFSGFDCRVLIPAKKYFRQRAMKLNAKT